MDLWEYACFLARQEAAKVLEAKRLREEEAESKRLCDLDDAADAAWEARRAAEREADAEALDRQVDRYYGRTGWSE